jgi:hypothetical protein
MSWFSKITGGKSAKSQLSAAPNSPDSYTQLAILLADYPAHRPPHIGDPLKMTDAQCDENLADLLAQRDNRLQTLSSFFRRQDIDISAAMNGGSQAVSEFAVINRWLLSWMPKRSMDIVSGDRETNYPRDKFMASDRSGAEIYLSLFSDLALLQGEAIRAVDPRFNWEVYRAPKGLYVSSEEEPEEASFLASEITDERHICLVRPSDDPDYWPTVLNLYIITISECHAMMSPMGYCGHQYGEPFNNALNKRFDQPKSGVC